MTAEQFMEDFIINIDDMAFDMIQFVIDEEFEMAAEIKSNMDKIVKKSKKYILKNDWTKFSPEDLEDFLNMLVLEITITQQELLGVKKEWALERV